MTSRKFQQWYCKFEHTPRMKSILAFLLIYLKRYGMKISENQCKGQVFQKVTEKRNTKMEKKIFPDLRAFHHFPGKTNEQKRISTYILINVSISNDKRRLHAQKQKTSYSCWIETWGHPGKSKDMEDKAVPSLF